VSGDFHIGKIRDVSQNFIARLLKWHACCPVLMKFEIDAGKISSFRPEPIRTFMYLYFPAAHPVENGQEIERHGYENCA
jgi:hypothetical protein